MSQSETPAPWSHRIASAFDIRLDDDLCAWFDEAWWARRGAGEFTAALSPQRLLDLDGDVIWPGFLPPDLLPIIGNDYGDWLCLRIGLANEVAEIVYWNHGGGDWIPYGPNLPEALLYAASREGAQRGMDGEPPSNSLWPAWAAERLSACGKAVLPFWEAEAKIDPLSALVEAGAARVPVGRDLCLRRLRRETLENSDRQRATALGVAWEPDFVSWLFDSALAPESYRGEIYRNGDEHAGEAFTQDWTGAEIEALRIEQLRANLGWPMDLAGWAAERRGDIPQAIPRYMLSLNASVFSDESTRFRTLWFSEGFGKFAAARLWEHRKFLSEAQQREPYLRLLWENRQEDLRRRVSQFWLTKAEEAVTRQDWRGAYDAYFRAGWDVGMARRGDYRVVLEGLQTATQQLGATGLAHLVSIHLRLLESKS